MFFTRETPKILVGSERALLPKDDLNLFKNPTLDAWLVFKPKLVIDTGFYKKSSCTRLIGKNIPLLILISITYGTTQCERDKGIILARFLKGY